MSQKSSASSRQFCLTGVEAGQLVVDILALNNALYASRKDMPSSAPSVSRKAARKMGFRGTEVGGNRLDLI